MNMASWLRLVADLISMQDPLHNDAPEPAPGLSSVPELPGSPAATPSIDDASSLERPDLRLVPNESATVPDSEPSIPVVPAPVTNAGAPEAVQPTVGMVENTEPPTEAVPEKIDYFAHLEDLPPEPAKAKSVIEAERSGENASGFDAHQVFAAAPVGGTEEPGIDEGETEALEEAESSADVPVAEAFDVEAFKQNRTAAYPFERLDPINQANHDELRALVPETEPPSTELSPSTGLPWHRLAVYVVTFIVVVAVALRLLGFIGT